MKIARFEHKGKVVWGSVHDDVVYILTGDIFEGATETKEKIPLKDVKLLPPIVPPKIIGIGLNYKLHIKESPFDPPEVPMMFLKASTSVISHLDPWNCDREKGKKCERERGPGLPARMYHCE
jgi:2-keto-4-pentenoate hydratase/2-oxohepta-3-ene-1,7-dioic acid hydratase in catechol pathway